MKKQKKVQTQRFIGSTKIIGREEWQNTETGEVIESSVLYESVKVKMDSPDNNMKTVKEFSMYDVREIVPGKDIEPEIEDIEELESLEDE